MRRERRAQGVADRHGVVEGAVVQGVAAYEGRAADGELFAVGDRGAGVLTDELGGQVEAGGQAGVAGERHAQVGVVGAGDAAVGVGRQVRAGVAPIDAAGADVERQVEEEAPQGSRAWSDQPT